MGPDHEYIDFSEALQMLIDRGLLDQRAEAVARKVIEGQNLVAKERSVFHEQIREFCRCDHCGIVQEWGDLDFLLSEGICPACQNMKSKD